MKKTVALLFIMTSALLLLSAATVSLGLEAGADYNMIKSGNGYRNYTYSDKIGAAASIPVLIEFTPSLALETGVSYYLKNFGYSRSVSEDTSSVPVKTLDYTSYNHFVELSAAFHYTYAIPQSSTLYLIASGGGFIGFWVYGSRAGYAYSISRNPKLTYFKDTLNLDNYSIFQAGVYASLGVKWQFSRKTSLFIRAGYSYTLTDLNKMQKYGAYPVHISTIVLSGGIMWRVN